MSRAPSSRLPGLWLYGTHAVTAALENPARTIHQLVMTAETAKTWKGAGFETVERKDLDRWLPAGAVHQGIAVRVEPLPALELEMLARTAPETGPALMVMLDQVTDPRNVGAILRSAAAFGALAVIVPDRHGPEETGTLAKAASGALERIPLVRVTNVARTLETLTKFGFWVVGLAGEASLTLAESGLSGKVVLTLGAEGEGLRRLTREHCDVLVRLPTSEAMESLNVSNAAAIALYEMVRTERVAK